MIELNILGIWYWWCQGCGKYRPDSQFPTDQCFVYYCEDCLKSGLAFFDWNIVEAALSYRP